MPSFDSSSSVLCGLLNMNALPTVRHCDYKGQSSVDKEEKKGGMSLFNVYCCIFCQVNPFIVI